MEIDGTVDKFKYLLHSDWWAILVGMQICQDVCLILQRKIHSGLLSHREWLSVKFYEKFLYLLDSWMFTMLPASN